MEWFRKVALDLVASHSFVVNLEGEEQKNFLQRLETASQGFG